jgi:hypothetical protein
MLWHRQGIAMASLFHYVVTAGSSIDAETSLLKRLVLGRL